MHRTKMQISAFQFSKEESAEANHSPLNDSDLSEVVTLLAEAADPRWCAIVFARQRNVIRSLAELIDADLWIWISQIATDSNGSSPAVYHLADGGVVDDSERARMLQVAQMLQELHRSNRAGSDGLVNGPGAVILATGQEHWLSISRIVRPQCVSIVTFCRRPSGAEFSQRDRALAKVVLDSVHWVHRAALQPNANELSPRETQVLNHILCGGSRRQLAEELQITAQTVADHCRQIYKKFAVNSRAQLMAKFIGEPRT